MYISTSKKQTEDIAFEYGQTAKPGDIFCLTGGLGAGKTAFSGGFAKGAGYLGRVTSPTFTLMNIYESERFTIYHFDLYRLKNEADLENIGFDEYINSDGVVLIEWPEKALPLLTERYTSVDIKIISKDDKECREIIIRENFGT